MIFACPEIQKRLFLECGKSVGVFSLEFYRDELVSAEDCVGDCAAKAFTGGNC